MFKKIVKKIIFYFGYEIKKVTLYDKWQREIPSEIFYWEYLIKTKKDWYTENFAERINPNATLQDILLKYIDKSQAKNKILDVGAGPLTSINKKNKYVEVEIYPIDPLADEYYKILKKYNIQPLVRTQQSNGEKLTDKFNENTFDISYSSNAIDHSYNPIKFIEQMIKVTKKKHFIILQIIEKEGGNENWSGLHQWNLFVNKKILWLQGKKARKINIIKKFKNTTQLVQLTKKKQWITAVFKKK